MVNKLVIVLMAGLAGVAAWDVFSRGHLASAAPLVIFLAIIVQLIRQQL